MRYIVFRSFLSILFLALIISPLEAGPPTNGTYRLRSPKQLKETIFAYPFNREMDRDNDFLKDHFEGKVAAHFRPYLVFDSGEDHTRPWEPVTLIQVRPVGCIGPDCPDEWKIKIKYVFLWAFDGGYGESSSCKNDHNGDNDSISLFIHSKDQGRTWILKNSGDVNIGDEAYISIFPDVLWPNAQNGGIEFPYIFLSSHKHHLYTNSWNDGHDSIYSDWGCNDDVNGNGAHYYACVHPDCLDPAYIDVFNNVGEPEAHDPKYFIGSLDRWYKGEHAWSSKEFNGGKGEDGFKNSSLKEMWMSHKFHKSKGFKKKYTAMIIGAM